eukprot:TRINITY_DN38277_c0_g1_i2.p1 TRINITY_DN38277_c0_g1~~TRINITY_DN38277_c0_g1_i2.p1  ORF type:complete len:195 (-),score=41.44 TRINITY_DN38277_c0_g1_i2:85-669(-)
MAAQRERDTLRAELDAAQAAAMELAAEVSSQEAMLAAERPAGEESSLSKKAMACLDQLEPVLASLPVEVVPGMAELQEEACDAFGRLRMVLWEAVHTGRPLLAVEPGSSRSGLPATRVITKADEAHTTAGAAQSPSLPPVHTLSGEQQAGAASTPCRSAGRVYQPSIAAESATYGYGVHAGNVGLVHRDGGLIY